jgi:peptidoglycan/LPS O-acetylase OafA/YrhL
MASTPADSGLLPLYPTEASRPTRIGHRLRSRAGFPNTTGSRLPGVDGLRAIAALWVVLFHIEAFSGGQFSHVPGLNLFLRSGSTGVSLFLVLSGFCLYIPFAGDRTDRFRTREFLLRRCRRLMPAYYTSLGFVLALNLGAGGWLGFHALSPFDAVEQAAAHALLVHPLFPSTFYALNGAYWSLGLEWQLYLALPLLVWGIRRFGIRRTLLTAVMCNVVYGAALGLVIHQGIIIPGSVLAVVVLPNQLPGRWAEFVFGMVAAELYVTGHIRWLAAKAWFAIPVLVPISLLISGWPLCHIVYGATFVSLLSLVLASDNVVSKVASWTPLVVIGTMSYSLYLVHQPLVAAFCYLLQVHAHTNPQQTFLLLVALLPLILIAAWLLFYTVERHTLTSGRAKRTAAESAPQPAA